MDGTTIEPNEIVTSTEWHLFAHSIDDGVEPMELHPHANYDSAPPGPDEEFCKDVFVGISRQVNFANIWGNFALRLMKVHYTPEEMLSFDRNSESREEFQKDFSERVNAFYYWLIQDSKYGMLLNNEYSELSKDNTGIPNNVKLLAAHSKLIWKMIVAIHDDFIAICHDLELPAASPTSLLLTEISHRISMFKEMYVVLR